MEQEQQLDQYAAANPQFAQKIGGKGRQQANIRIRDMKKKTAKGQKASGYNSESMPMRSGTLAPIAQKSASKKKKEYERPEFNAGPNSVILEKVPKQKKTKKFREDHSDMQPVLAPSLNSLQNVDQFKHFLLSNDSQYSEYLNSELLKQAFDTHMMKEGMITFMAQMMGNGSLKDNFFLKTRSAL